MNLDEKINQTQAAELLGISMARMSELCRDNWIKRDANGKVTPRVTYAGYIASIKEGRNSADIDLKVLKGKLSTQTYDQREGKYQQAANREAYEFCEPMVAMIVNFLDGLPSAVTREPETRKRIVKVVDDFRNKIGAQMRALKATYDKAA
jgi:hypothetical protein